MIRTGPGLRSFLLVTGIGWGALGLVAIMTRFGPSSDAPGVLDARLPLLYTCGFAAVLVGIAGCVAAARSHRAAESSLRFASLIARGEFDASLPRTRTEPFQSLNHELEAIAVDIRDRIAAAAQGEKGLRLILAGMVEGVVAVNEQFEVLLINERAASMLAVTTAAEGTSLDSIAEASLISRPMRRVLASGEAATTEIEYRREGLKKTLELTIAPLRDVEGRTTGAVTVMHDMSAVKLAEKMRRDFVANVSHELKTPLTAIHGAAATLIDADDMPPAVRTRFLESIYRNSERLEQLITDLLELSQIQQGAERLDRERIDVTRLIADVVGRLEESANAKGNTLELQTDHSVHLNADRLALSSIVENLISNAIRYTPSGGAVRAKVESRDSEVVLSVSDDGIGIAKKHQARIFERFYRVDKARSRAVGGTGLGLAIVKNYVQALGGQIEIESEAGRGATFIVSIPQPR